MSAASRPTVLALRALGLGDALTGVPALRGLRRAFPQAHLVLACPAAVGALLVGHGVVDDVLDVAGIVPLAPDALVRAVASAPPALAALLAAGVDVGVNLHGNGPQSAAALAALSPARTTAFASPAHPAGVEHRADEHEVDRWCRLVAAAGGTCSREDLVLDDLAAIQDARAGGAGSTGPVVLHPGAASASRRWPAQRWAALAGALSERGHRAVVTGTPGEAAACATAAGTVAENLCGRLDLPALTRTVAGAALLVCGDTGVAHVATAARTPSVLLFGPTPPALWGPAIDPDRHAVLWPVGRAHASRAGDPHADALDPVLAATTVDDVLGAALALLTERSPMP